MPVVTWALTAGSVGDIQGLIALLFKLGQALYDANDASSDYKELKKEIDTFCVTLIEVLKVQDSVSSEISVNPLATEIAHCRADLQDFLAKHPIQNRWNKIKWAFWGNSAATSLRAILLTHRQTIQLLLTTFVVLRIHSIHDTKETTLARFSTMINPSGALATRTSRISFRSPNKGSRQCAL
jgi:hypothetical protein